MHHLLLKTCVAGACALGFVALDRPAKAFTPPALDETGPSVIQVQDMEDEAVMEDLQPDIVAPGSDDEEMSEEPMKDPAPEGEMEDE